MHDTLAATTPKTPWKPRVTLLAEVGKLLTRGMMDNYDCESEHSIMAKEPSTRGRHIPAHEEGGASSAIRHLLSGKCCRDGGLPGKQPHVACFSYSSDAHSICSDSPVVELPKVQADVHLAVNSMLSAKRSLDLKIQHGLSETLRKSLHQCMRWKKPLPMKRPRSSTQGVDLKVRVKCTKVQSWRPSMTIGWPYKRPGQLDYQELEESEAAYSEALSENMAMKSLQCMALHQEHAEHMCELEEWALDAKNKSHQDFLLAHQAILHHALQSLKENLHSSYHILLGPSSSSPQSIPFTRAPSQRGYHLWLLLPNQNPSSPYGQKGDIPQQMHRETHPWMRIPPWPCRKNCQAPREGRQLTGSPL